MQAAQQPDREVRAILATAECGDLPAEFGVRHVHTGVLADTYFVDAPDFERVVKIYRCDLAELLHGDPDPRFRTLGRLLPISPFFGATEAQLELVRDELPIAIPRVLAEGRSADGVRFTVMRRLGGCSDREPVARGPARRRELSHRLGELTARLHGVPLPADRGYGDDAAAWIDDCAEVLHCAIDHLPAFVGGSIRRRHRLHARMHRVLERVQNIGVGPCVLAHCDLHPSNLLFDADDRLCGVIDFQLTCPGPAALDFRWLCLLDADAFLESYGVDPATEDAASWLGHFVDMLWQILGLVLLHRFLDTKDQARIELSYARQFEYLLRLLENDRERRGPAWVRRARSASLYGQLALRRMFGQPTPSRRNGS